MFIDEKLSKELGQQLSGLKNEVVLKYYTQELECIYCRETRTLLEELIQVSPKLKLEVFNFVNDKAEAVKYGIDKIPAIAVTDGLNDFGIRLYGIPSGYEFSSLLEAIKLVGTGATELDEETINKIKSIDTEIHLQVFVTPTCPYCPAAVVLAHHFAYLNPKIKADMIEATEFPHLARKFNVMGVPRTVVNDIEYLEGAAPANMLLEKIESVLK